MRKNFLLVATLLTASALLAGCGGGGGSPTAVPAGRYVGSWSNGTDDSGTVDLTVAADRTLSGTTDSTFIKDNGVAGVGRVNGKIAANGRTEFDPTWSTPDSTLPTGSDYAGTLRYDPATRTLKGTLKRDAGDFKYPSAWTLTLQ